MGRKNIIINPDGSGRFNPEVNNIYFPRKAEQLGYMQAYVEAFIGMKELGYSIENCRRYLNLTNEQTEQLCGLNIIFKFRIFPSFKITSINEKAAECFKNGYERAYREIAEKTEDSELLDLIRISGIKAVMTEIKKFLPDDFYTEYCELYNSVV